MFWRKKPTLEQRMTKCEQAINGIFDCLKLICNDLDAIKISLELREDKPRLVVNNRPGGD